MGALATVLLAFGSQALLAACVRVQIDESQVVSKLMPWSVGMTYDAVWFRSGHFNPRDQATQAVIRSLSPAILRVGGTAADWLYYNVDNYYGDPKPGNVTKPQWGEVCTLAQASNCTLVFGLNARFGFNESAGHAWDASNARGLIEYTRQIGCPVSGWELGNELNAPYKLFSPGLNAGHTLQLGALLTSIYGEDNVGMGTPSSPWRIGPDVTHRALISPDGGRSPAETYLETYLNTLLKNGTYGESRILGPVDAVTWHYYLPPGKTLAEYLTASVLDEAAQSTQLASQTVGAFNKKRPPAWTNPAMLWLGESGIELNSDSNPRGPTGQHLPGLDDGFAGLLVWLDRLGLAFATGHNMVAQQQIPNFIIQDPGPGKNFSAGTFSYVEPSVLGLLAFKRIVTGAPVYAASVASPDKTSRGAAAVTGKAASVLASHPEQVRVYAFSSERGSPVVMALNLQGAEAEIDVSVSGSGLRGGNPCAGTPSAVSGMQWSLQAFPDTSNVSSPGVQLHGNQIQYSSDGAAPAIQAKGVALNSCTVQLPAWSAVFARFGA